MRLGCKLLNFLLVMALCLTQELFAQTQPTDVPQTCNLTPNQYFSIVKSQIIAGMLRNGFPRNPPTDNQVLCVLNTPASITARLDKIKEIANFITSSQPNTTTMTPTVPGQQPSSGTPPQTKMPQFYKILSTIPYGRGFTAYSTQGPGNIYTPTSQDLKNQLIWNNPNPQCQNLQQGIPLHTQPKDATNVNLYYVTCKDRSGCKVIIADKDDCYSQILGQYSVKEALPDNIPVGGRNENLMLLGTQNPWSVFMLNNNRILINSSSLKNSFGFTLPQQSGLFLLMLKNQGNAVAMNNLNLGCKTGASCLLQKTGQRYRLEPVYTANGSFTLNMADNQLSFLPFVRIPANSKFDIIYNKNLYGAGTPSSIDQYTTNISDGILAGKEIIFSLPDLKERRTLVCTDPSGCDFSCVTTSPKTPLDQCGQNGTYIFLSRGTYNLEMSLPAIATPLQPIIYPTNQTSINLLYSHITRGDLFGTGNEEEYIAATYNGKKVILRASLCLNYREIRAAIASGVKILDFNITCKQDKGCTLRGLIPQIKDRPLDIPLVLEGQYIIGSPLSGAIEQKKPFDLSAVRGTATFLE